jgi:hypothetical protein
MRFFDYFGRPFRRDNPNRYFQSKQLPSHDSKKRGPSQDYIKTYKDLFNFIKDMEDNSLNRY